MTFGKISQLLSSVALGALGTLASAQLAKANPIQDTRLVQTICTATERIGRDEFKPLTEWLLYTRTIEEAHKACQEKVDDFTRAIENSNHNGTSTGIIPDRIEDHLINLQTGKSYLD